MKGKMLWVGEGWVVKDEWTRFPNGAILDKTESGNEGLCVGEKMVGLHWS